MTERRYTDEEVERILARAVEADSALAPAPGGLTLAEIQAAGAQAGLSPRAVAVAAAVNDRSLAVPTERRWMGVPLSVQRTVPLRRALAAGEWERLVAELRITFNADGRERTDGARREWRNGGLRVVHEPVAEGAYLSLRTESRERFALDLFAAQAAFSAFFLVSQGVMGMGGAAGSGLFFLLLVIGIAGSMWRATSVRQWGRERAEQFEAIGRLAWEMAETPTAAEARDAALATAMDAAVAWLFGRRTREPGRLK